MNQCSERACPPRRSGVRAAALAAGCLALAATVGVPVPATASDSDSDSGPRLESNLERLSYMIGLQMGASLRGQGLGRIEAAALALGLEDVFNDRDPRLTNEEMQAAFAEYQASRQTEMARDAEGNLAAGQAFLASNADRDGVLETADGLQYRVLRSGDGAKPEADDQVVVHYRGRLLDGTEFDSSYARGEPAEFMVGGVIRGWQIALQAMPAGSHWEVWIPAELAYGEQGAGGAIGPNQTLHFEIELIEVKPKG